MAQRVMVDALAAGNVQSFVELFYLTARPTERLEKHISDSELEEVAACEAAAEAGRRSGDSAAVVKSYVRIADIYKGLDSHVVQMFFLERAIDLCHKTADHVNQMKCLHSLGLAKEAIGDLPAAIKCHEHHKSLAGRHGDGDHTIQANAQLVLAYTRHAADAEARPGADGAGITDAHQLYLKALSAARQCGDSKAEARANYDVGRTLVLLHRAAEAVPYLKNYLRLSVTAKDAADEVSQAYAALAAAHQAAGDGPAAAQCLEELLNQALASGNLRAQAEAAENLALIHAKHGEYEKAESQLQLAYGLRKQLVAAGTGSRAELEKVRILVGLIKGASRVSPLMSTLIAIDIKALLNWKLRGKELQSDAHNRRASTSSALAAETETAKSEAEAAVAPAEAAVAAPAEGGQAAAVAAEGSA